MPALSANEIDAGVRWRGCQRGDVDWTGARSARAHFETPIRTYRWANTFPLVRGILRNERSHRAIQNLFCGGMSMFPWKISRRDRPRAGAGRNFQLLFLDERRGQNSSAASDYSGRAIGNRAIHRVHEIREGDRPQVSRSSHRTHLRSYSAAPSLWRFTLA